MLCLSSLATHGCSRSRVMVRVSPCLPPAPGHPPSGPGHCAPPSSSSAAGGCRCQISCSAGCTRGCPARVCCRNRDRTLSPRPLSIPHDAPKFSPGCPIPTPHSQPALAGARLGPPRLQTDFCGTASLALGNPKNKLLFSLLPLHPPKSRARPSRRDGARSGRGGARRAWTCLPTRGKQSVDPRMLWLTAGPGEPRSRERQPGPTIPTGMASPTRAGPT